MEDKPREIVSMSGAQFKKIARILGDMLRLQKPVSKKKEPPPERIHLRRVPASAYFSAGSLEKQATVELETVYRGEEPIEGSVDAKALQKIAGATLPKEELSMRLGVDRLLSARLEISAGGVTYYLAFQPETFALAETDDLRLKIDGLDLPLTFARALRFTTREISRYEVDAVHLDLDEDDAINAASTDGRRLGRTRLANPSRNSVVKHSGYDPAGYNLPADAARFVSRYSRDGQLTRLLFYYEAARISSYLGDSLRLNLVHPIRRGSAFPDWRKIFRNESQGCTQLARLPLLAAVRKVAQLAPATIFTAPSIQLSYADGLLSVETKEMFTTEARFTLPATGALPFNCLLSPTYLLQSLEVLREDTVRIYHQGPTNGLDQIIFEESDFRMALMPMRNSKEMEQAA